MDDIYHYTASDTMVTPEGKLETLPTVKYISTSREITKDIRLGIAQKICKEFGLEYDGKSEDEIDSVLWEKFRGRNVIYQVYRKTDFSKTTLAELLEQDLFELI